MGLFDRLFGRKEKDQIENDEGENWVSDYFTTGKDEGENWVGDYFSEGADDGVDEPKSASKPEKLKDLSQTDRNNLVEFNAYIANVVRYPNSPSERKAVADILDKPVTNRDELQETLSNLSTYELGTDGYSDTRSRSSHKIADTLSNEFEDGQQTSVHELFDSVNQKYSSNEVMYSGRPSYSEKINTVVLQDAAAFVHDHDTLDDVYKRNEEVYADVEKDFGVSLDQFAKFKDVEDSFQDGLEMTDGEDYAKRYNGYYSADFHSSYDVVNYLQEYKDIYNTTLNKNDEKFLTDNDLRAFADFATAGISDVEKENGFSLSDTLAHYDDNKLDYLRDSVSRLQSDARNQSDCTLTTRYDFIREDTATDHEDAIREDEIQREAQEREEESTKRKATPSVEPKVETPKVTPTKAKEKDEGVEP